MLRFDNANPGQVEPAPVPAWIGRADFPLTLHLGHPAGPPPLSGIRGYAASIDRLSGGGSCLALATCSAGETELREGGGKDSLAIAELPEGTSYLHAVAVSGSGTRSATSATTDLHVDKTDPVTLLAGNPDGWSDRPLTLTAIATDAASGMIAGGAGEPFTAIRIDGGAPVSAAGNQVSATVIASGVHAVAYYARDAAGNVADGGVSNGRRNPQPATATVRIDRDPPRVAFAGAQDPLDPERIEARATDSLSGLDPASGSIGVRPAGSGERFVELPSERSGSLLSARWDSEAYPPGEYEFRATVDDIAGNSASSLLKSDGSPLRLSSPLKVATTLLSRFRSRTVRYGRGASFSGRLFAGRRAPLPGMPVRLIERFDPGAAAPERVTTVRTGDGGTFSFHLGPGPSRDLIAIAPPTATLRGASSQPLRLDGARRSEMRRLLDGRERSAGSQSSSAAVSPPRGAIPSGARRCSCSSACPACPGASSARSTPTRAATSATPTASPTTTGAARASVQGDAPAQADWPCEPRLTAGPGTRPG